MTKVLRCFLVCCMYHCNDIVVLFAGMADECTVRFESLLKSALFHFSEIKMMYGLETFWKDSLLF